MLNRRTLITFLLGLALGALLVVLGRPLLGDRLPAAVGGQRESVEGVVTAKQREGDRLLVTIVTPAGATLVTFTRRVPEIALLVDEGDRVTLSLPRYQPFLQDPEIARVAKSAITGPLSPPDSAKLEQDTVVPPDSQAPAGDARWYD